MKPKRAPKKPTIASRLGALEADVDVLYTILMEPAEEPAAEPVPPLTLWQRICRYLKEVW